MRYLAMIAAICLSTPALCETPYILVPSESSFEDTAFALENAIISRGLVVDHVSHVGEMLARTGADLGATEQIFEAADVYQFCSAVLSRKVMEADPWNIVHCPYSIFVAERGGRVTIGYDRLPEGPMGEVQALLEALATEASTGF